MNDNILRTQHKIIRAFEKDLRSYFQHLTEDDIETILGLLSYAQMAEMASLFGQQTDTTGICPND